MARQGISRQKATYPGIADDPLLRPVRLGRVRSEGICNKNMLSARSCSSCSWLLVCGLNKRSWLALDVRAACDLGPTGREKGCPSGICECL